jgi:hypothetical protein
MKVPARSNRVILISILAFVLLAFSINSAVACRSYAEKKEDAEEFCEMKLKCKPPLVLACYGQTREWKCRCEKPKEKKVEQMEKKMEMLEQKKESDYSIKKDMDKSSPKLMEDK